MRFFIFLLFLVFVQLSFSQNGTIQGTLTDEDGEALYGANAVVDVAQGWAAQTDFNGNYTISVPAGTYYILFSYIGKEKKIEEVTVSVGETYTLNAQLLSNENELEIVTVTGGKYEKAYGEEVISIEVVSSELIESNAAQAGEVLNKVPGYTQLGESPSIRGGSGWSSTASSRVLFLVDGVPQLSPENGGIFMETLPLENIQQVEVIKGASSALYGSSALNGIINFRTAWAKDSIPVRKITTGIGVYNKFDANLIKSKNDREHRMVNPNWWWEEENHLPLFFNTTYEHRQRFDKLDLVVGAHYRHDQSFRKDNEIDRFRVNGKMRHISDKIEGLTIGTAWNFVYEEGGQFFLWSGLDSMSLIPSDPANVGVPDIRTDYVNRRISVSPFFSYYSKKGNKHAINTRYYNNQSTNFGFESVKTNHIYGEYLFTKTDKGKGLNLITGTQLSYTTAQGETFDEASHKAYSAGVFVQAEKKFFDKLTFSGGLRIEYNQVDSITPENKLQFFNLFAKKDITSPVKPMVRFGMNYEIVKGTYLRAGFGQGFRIPTINEYFIDTKRGLQVVSNPNLIPEAGWSAEVGIKQGVKVGQWQGFFDLAGFYTKYVDLIDFVPYSSPGTGLAVQAQNLDNATIAGIETSAMGQGKLLGYPLRFLVGYTWIHPILKNPSDDRITNYPDTYEYLDYRSKHNFKADIESTIEKFTLGISAIYVSNMINIPITRGVLGISDYRELNDTGYFTFDARIGFAINEKSKLAFVAKNVFNAQYMQRPGILEAPRTFTMQYQVGF
ncbi:MAG: TonB-dependent receptor [Chitinophagales bacterium]